MTLSTLLLFGLRGLLLLSLIAYGVYAMLAVRAAYVWRRARRAPNPAWTPAVTIFKPVRGVDAEAYENFASFCRQDYPPDRIQYLFGALDPADPALELVRRLQAEFPHLDIGIVAGDQIGRGFNLKVRNLAGMLPEAKHDLFLLCDSDMRVGADYLRRVVAPFAPVPGQPNSPSARLCAPQPPISGEKFASPPVFPSGNGEKRPVGLVTCPYRGSQAHSFAAVLEALGIGADFIPSALVSRMLEGVAFAFGSTIALPRSVLAELGGFEALADELADDFRLGNGASRAGYTVVLSDYSVDDVLGPENFRAMWGRRLRWARTVRSCRPAGYAGAWITYGFALALLFLCAMGFSAYGWLGFGLTLGVRFATALHIAHSTEDPNIARFLWLLPISDLFGFALYIASYCGNRIVWRGEHFRLLPGGKIVHLQRSKNTDRLLE